MDQKSLRERLAKLHAELAKAHQQNPATRQSLGEVLPDVKRMVEEPAGAAAPSVDKSLPERLERVAVQFEAEHPTLAASARRLIDLLNEVGI
jgi:septal ring factor EnvC (AmiA/AmiB activator)